MADAEVVEVGQWRKGVLGSVYAVLGPHPRRRGFWLCVSNHFPYRVESVGRRELLAMPVASVDYFGKGGVHPGVRYVETLAQVYR